ncbi:hypothetical protein CERSUDRAFT_95612 [Gelatoporia subvermispora B]|uniref:Heterokaryon incompatibility domain-containing protein n=1 Tax=Ceriporiopsis subvermispora (strain B) TaxID=914234 RepID=M2QVZ4_CERS8|nr:hypothetical protein CERSUDRAFT_95612 [Gelatoporia subvermispora B]
MPYGLDSPSISRTDGTSVTVSEKVAFFQAWLFFGTLAEVCSLCGLDSYPGEFDSESTFDMGNLNGLPMKLFASAQRSWRAGKQLQEQLYAIIRQVQLMITRASDWEDEHEYTLPQCEVLWSIHILLRLLSLAFLCHSPQPYIDSNYNMKISVADMTVDWRPEGQIRFTDFVLSRLLSKGWCRSEVRHLLQGFNVSISASYLERPHAFRNHEACTETTCMAYQIDEKDYRTLHIREDCACAPIGVDPKDLRNVLAFKSIPKITISEDLQLHVVGDEDYPYIAISHVWADGLGNPYQNSLPTCQNRRLRAALWIDTLCIPVAPEFKEYRKLAIRLLSRTYSEAIAVLVLDRELCRFQSRPVPHLEIGIRMMCSGWMKRLWTLQEASIAVSGHGPSNPGNLYIQMADGPVYWNRQLRSFQYKVVRVPKQRLKPSSLTITVQEVKADLLYELHTQVLIDDRLPPMYDIQRPRFETQFQRIMSAVQNRSTSKAEDEPICMASLLGLDLSQVLSVDTAEERMAIFYRLLHEIPTVVIFAHFGTPNPATLNLQLKPFRWAPKSLLRLEDPMIINMAFAAQRFADPPWPLHGLCEQDGLHIQHSGFIFTELALATLRNGQVIENTSDGMQYILSWPGTTPECIGPESQLALVFQTDICSDVVVSLVGRNENPLFAPFEPLYKFHVWTAMLMSDATGTRPLCALYCAEIGPALKFAS